MKARIAGSRNGQQFSPCGSLPGIGPLNSSGSIPLRSLGGECPLFGRSGRLFMGLLLAEAV